MAGNTAPGGIGGLGNALEMSRLATQLINKTLDQTGQPAQSMPAKNVQSARAVAGVGQKINIHV